MQYESNVNTNETWYSLKVQLLHSKTVTTCKIATIILRVQTQQTHTTLTQHNQQSPTFCESINQLALIHSTTLVESEHKEN